MFENLSRITNVFVAEYISFQLEVDLLDHLAAVVRDVHVDIYARPTDPDLSV
jgi:hypothetical protein